MTDSTPRRLARVAVGAVATAALAGGFVLTGAGRALADDIHAVFLDPSHPNTVTVAGHKASDYVTLVSGIRDNDTALWHFQRQMQDGNLSPADQNADYAPPAGTALVITDVSFVASCAVAGELVRADIVMGFPPGPTPLPYGNVTQVIATSALCNASGASGVTSLSTGFAVVGAQRVFGDNGVYLGGSGGAAVSSFALHGYLVPIH